MQFCLEKIKDNLEEVEPILHEHYKEIAHFQDIPLDPDYDQYIQLEDAGVTRFYVARDKDNYMIGYALFFVRHNIHYKTSLQAMQDIIYIRKQSRGIGGRFIAWCDEQLRAEGVNVVYHHVKNEHNFGPLLEKLDYKLIDHIYGRRL